jgi:hypothetical protein
LAHPYFDFLHEEFDFKKVKWVKTPFVKTTLLELPPEVDNIDLDKYRDHYNEIRATFLDQKNSVEEESDDLSTKGWFVPILTSKEEAERLLRAPQTKQNSFVVWNGESEARRESNIRNRNYTLSVLSSQTNKVSHQRIQTIPGGFYLNVCFFRCRLTSSG